jgi:spermidine synthase
MNRDGFLLGLLATSGQILLLREVVTAFGGSELLIGTALFGWLVWVALGAWIGGRSAAGVHTAIMFTLGGWLLPISLVGVRLVSTFITDVPGEIVPLHLAMLISMIAVAPVAFVSGWLFPAVARLNRTAADAITTVYLFEGLGAFVAGVIVAVLVGRFVGNVGMSLIVGIAVAVMTAFASAQYCFFSIVSGSAMAAVLIGTGAGLVIDRLCDQSRYPGYTVEQSFDTPYGHQTVLSRDSSLVLVTDNAVEATYPNLQVDENLLVPALVYNPTAESVLYFGRAEFGLAELAAAFPGVRLTAVDPRGGLGDRLGRVRPLEQSTMQVRDDPLAFLSKALPHSYDIVILSTGRMDSYRASRMVTPQALDLVGRCLKDSGILVLPTTYDSDRYVSAESAELLAMITRTVQGSLPLVTLWPGNGTLILASEKMPLDLSLDTILTRIGRMPYKPEYVNDFYLGERLDQMKLERLSGAISVRSGANDVLRPTLASREAWFRARMSRTDILLAALLFGRPIWLVIFPVLILLFFWWTLSPATESRRIGMFMYFVAGAVSLSLELVSFYLYQSNVGSLYTNMAVLIGTFMLGLALGAYLANRTLGSGIGRLSMITLAAAAVVFGFTWRLADYRLALIYHALFLLVAALATGSLFVAATRRYYASDSNENRGFGYAAELVGSAVGALLTTTVLLPVIGVNWLLFALVMVCVLGLVSDILVYPFRRTRPS